MTNIYVNQLENELPGILNKFSGIGTDLYTPVSRACLAVLCKGVQKYVYQWPRQAVILDFIKEPIRSARAPTELEWNIIRELLDYFGNSGYTFSKRSAEANNHINMRDLTEAAEYVAERMGCTDYCKQALVYLAGDCSPGQKPN